MKVLIGTQNPAKIEGARNTFLKFFDDVEIEGVKVSSNVPEQPFNEEVLQGARNRVAGLKEYAKANGVKADFYVAVESGIVDYFDEYINFNIAVMENNEGLESVGISQGFPIPERLIEEINEKSLGKVMDRVFSGDNLGSKAGGISFLTKGQVERKDIVDNAFTMALIKYINGDLWK